MGKFDEASARRAALITRAAGRAQERRPALNHVLDIVCRPEVAALRLKADDVVAGPTWLRELGRNIEKLAELRVPEPPSEVLVDERNAVVHIVENGAHDLACRLDLGARRGQFLFVLLVLGNVAGRADHANGVPFGRAVCDSALPRPAPGFVIGEIAVLDEQMRGHALEVIGDRFAILRQVIGVNAAAGFLGRQNHAIRHAEDRAQQRRIIDRVVEDIPVVDAVIDRFERKGITLFVARLHPRRSYPRTRRRSRRFGQSLRRVRRLGFFCHSVPAALCGLAVSLAYRHGEDLYRVYRVGRRSRRR